MSQVASSLAPAQLAVRVSEIFYSLQGESSRVGLPTDHAQWGKYVVVSAGLLFLSTAALWWLDRKHVEARPTSAKVLAVVQVLLAAVAFTFVVLAGHSGAQAVWGPIVQNTTPGTFPHE